MMTTMIAMMVMMMITHRFVQRVLLDIAQPKGAANGHRIAANAQLASKMLV